MLLIVFLDFPELLVFMLVFPDAWLSDGYSNKRPSGDSILPLERPGFHRLFYVYCCCSLLKSLLLWLSFYSCSCLSVSCCCHPALAQDLIIFWGIFLEILGTVPEMMSRQGLSFWTVKISCLSKPSPETVSTSSGREEDVSSISWMGFQLPSSSWRKVNRFQA